MEAPVCVRQQPPFCDAIVNITTAKETSHSFSKQCVFDFQMNDIIRLISEFQQSKYGKVLYKWLFIPLKSLIFLMREHFRIFPDWLINEDHILVTLLP